jgi:hypothetical protein
MGQFEDLINSVLQSGREEVSHEIREALSKNRGIRALTQPYRSGGRLSGVVVDALPATSAARTQAAVVFRKGFTLSLFSYGVGEEIQLNNTVGNGTRKATEADTNLQKGSETVGDETVIIDSLSMGQTGASVEYPAAALTAYADSDVLDAAKGGPQGAVLFDPSANIAPPEMFGPMYGENVLWQALAPNCDVVFNWDRERVQHLGTLEQMFCGSGQSLLRANGEPQPMARFMIPESRVWRAKGSGKGNSIFSLDITVRRSVVVPITLVRVAGATAGDFPLPTTVHCEMTARVHGLAIRPKAGNS